MTSQRRRADRGQTSAEFTGMIVLIAGVLVAIAGLGLNTGLANALETAVCTILQQQCGVTAAASHVPKDKCETSSSSTELAADVVVFSVDVGGTGKLTLSRAVDANGKEHWYVQQEGEVRLGVDAMVGEQAGLGDLGEGVSGEVKALLRGSGGAKMEFPTQQAAKDFITAAEHEPVKQALTGWDPTGITHWLADKVDGHHYAPPKPTEYFFDGGGKLEGSVDAKGGVGSIGGKESATAVVGVKFKPNADGTANKTVYVKLTAEAAGRFGLLDTVQGEAGAKDEVVVGIEYDGQGRPKTATLEVAGTLKAQIGPGGPVGGKQTITSIAGLAPKGAPKVSDTMGVGTTGKFKFTVDLTQGNNLRTVADGLHSVGVPMLQNDGSGSTPDPVTGVKGIYGLFDSGAPGTYVTATSYDTSSTNYTAGIKGGDGWTFGVDGSLKLENSKITGGSYYQPGQGWVPWVACSK